MSALDQIKNIKTDDAKFLAVYRMQEDIERRERELEEDKEELMRLYKVLSNTQNDTFVFTDLRERRYLNMDWIRENLPDYYDECISVSNADAGKILFASFVDDRAACGYLAELNPTMWEELASITITRLESAMKRDRRSLKLYRGKAYTTKWEPCGKTKLVYKYAQPELMEPTE